MTPRTFAELLRHHRLARQMTQQELAEASKLGPDTIGGLERGVGKGRTRLATIKRLADALDLSPSERAELQEAALGRTGATDARGATRPKDNLPCELSDLIGREADVEAVIRLLNQHRLVTLTGPGGVGKTRLAVQVARGLVETMPDGVRLADLGSLGDPSLVARTMATAVDVEPVPGRRLVTALAQSLRPRRLLLVLDNCEHLADACARLVEDLLGACPRLHVLATSREPLGCQGEATWPVAPLGVPPAGPRGALRRGGAAVRLRATVRRPRRHGLAGVCPDGRQRPSRG